MKFICIGYYEPALMDALPPAELAAVMSRCRPHMANYEATGQVLVDAGLASESRLVQRQHGQVRVTDGPFAEAKEMVGSVLLLEAADMADALRVAAMHPSSQVPDAERLRWRMEVRPVDYFKAADAPAG